MSDTGPGSPVFIEETLGNALAASMNHCNKCFGDNFRYRIVFHGGLVMDDQHLYEQVKSIVSKVVEARSDGVVSFGELSAIAGEIVNAAAHVMEAIKDPTHLSDLVLACEKLFDEYFEPIDLKGVPNFLEPTVDGLIRSQIRPMIQRIYDARNG